MNKTKVAVVSMSLVLSTGSMAGTMGPIEQPAWTPVVTLSGGPAWSTNGQPQTLLIRPDVNAAYVASKNTEILGEGEIFAGMQRRINDTWTGQIGLAFAAASNANLSGDIWDDADPDFNNSFYNYQVQHERVSIKGKLLMDAGKVVTPYVSGSVGAGFNRSHAYTITPRIFQEIPGPLFGNKNITAFSYTAGIGLQKAVTNHVQVGVGYEFASWGRSQLAPGDTISNGLSLSNLYTNSLQFSISFTV